MSSLCTVIVKCPVFYLNKCWNFTQAVSNSVLIFCYGHSLREGLESLNQKMKNLMLIWTQSGSNGSRRSAVPVVLVEAVSSVIRGIFQRQEHLWWIRNWSWMLFPRLGWVLIYIILVIFSQTVISVLFHYVRCKRSRNKIQYSNWWLSYAPVHVSSLFSLILAQICPAAKFSLLMGMGLGNGAGKCLLFSFSMCNSWNALECRPFDVYFSKSQKSVWRETD